MKLIINLWALALIGVLLGSLKICGAQGVSTTVGGLSTTPTKVGAASVFWNPASIGFTDNTIIETNITLIGGWLIYDRAGNQPVSGDPFDSSSTQVLAPSPFVSLSSPLGTDYFRFGYATYFPSGGIADFDDLGSQKYDLISGKFLPWSHQFNLNYSPNKKWSFGASFIYTAAYLDAELDIDMGKLFTDSLALNKAIKEHSSLASRVKIDGSMAHSFGGNFGVLYRPTVQWSFGASFLLPMNYEFEQNMNLSRLSFFELIDVASESVGFQSETDVKTRLKIQTPAVLAAGFRYQPFGYWTGEYYGRYVFSSLTRFASIRFEESPLVTMEGKERNGPSPEDTYFIGTTQSFSVWKSFLLGLSTGYHWNGVKDEIFSTTSIDFDTLNIGLFGKYRWKKNLRLGIEYAHSFMFERNVTNSKATNSGDMAIVEVPSANGNYRAGVDRLGLSVGYDF